MPNQPNWLSLPVEIWLQILGLKIPLRDLAELCLTCYHFLSIARPVLYRHVTLTAEKDSHPNRAVTNTFALLSRDVDLALRVREMTLDSHSRSEFYFQNPGLVDVPSLRNLRELKRLTIIGDISRHATRTAMASFIKILHDLELDELRFPSPGRDFRPFILPLTTAQLSQLANPKHITFHGGAVDNEQRLVPRFHTIFTAARPTLTSLSLTGGCLHLNVLFALHFPHLRSLAIINTFDIQLSCPPGFNAFLSAHHETIEDLHLGYTERHNLATAGVLFPAAILFDAASELHPQFLPNLRVFRGHCQNLEMMARARMRCLANLRELTLSSALQDPDLTVADIRRMLDALEAAGRLDALKTLDCDLFQWDESEHDIVPTFVSRLGALCGPTLEVWRTLLPFAGSWSLDHFTAFPRLRNIAFPRDKVTLNILGPSDPRAAIHGEQMLSIAETCDALEEVNIVSSMVTGEEDTCWRVYRSVSGLQVKQISGPDLGLRDEAV
ncbi:hypothetical protein B0H14DRAFT_2795167 [Mycena olivaceomarginata]|nr:hypothetical protein B0H14DRAFT_2795167 [Mycena olivaceomarginata]